MTSEAVTQLSLRRFARFWRTPKGLLILVLLPLTALAVSGNGPRSALTLASAITAAGVVDLVLQGAARGVWAIPSAGILTGWLVALVLAPQEPPAAVIVTAAIAVVSKQFVRTRGMNVFNPAALALVVSAVAFSSAQSWWGALPDLGPWGLLAVTGTGLFIADRVNKLPAVLTFLAVYFAMFTSASFAGSPDRVAEVFRSPDLQAVVFFALFMLDDPPSSPVRYQHQITFGIIAAAVSYITFMLFGVVYFLFAGLLVANAWEGARRAIEARSRRRSRPTNPPSHERANEGAAAATR